MPEGVGQARRRRYNNANYSTKGHGMWLLQIVIASFWWFLGVNLLFRESLVWSTVDHIAWFRMTFRGPSTRKWERFCRDAGLLCLATGCLLFLGLPHGMGVVGLFLAPLPLLLRL